MTAERPPSVDRDGVRTYPRDVPAWRRPMVVGAVVLGMGAIAALVVLRGGARSEPAPVAVSTGASSPTGAGALSASPRRVAAAASQPGKQGGGDVPPRAAEPVPDDADGGNVAPAARAADAAPDAPVAPRDQRALERMVQDVIAGMRASGQAEGLAAFPPLGTSPPKPGIIVPDDFVLPPGYMRYHQSTDDGQALPPILAFSPDYEFVDANGDPVAIPDDLVVPPDMAPEGLPIRMLELPGRQDD